MRSAPLQRFVDKMNSLDRAVWVWCGDSITHGAVFTQGLRDYVELVEERVRHECKRFLHIFVNTAIQGNTTREIKDQFDWRVKRFQPDLFCLMIGMNDCKREFNMDISEFRANLEEIIERVRHETPAEVLIHTCCAAFLEQMPERARYPEFMDAVRRVTAEQDIAVIDHHAQWEKVRLSDPKRFASWMANPYHPNGAGHWVFAERVLIELGIGPLKETPPPKSPSHA